jgi:hypothetical protein
VGKFYRGTVAVGVSSAYPGYYVYFANEQLPEGLWHEGGGTFSGFPTQAGSYELDVIAVNEATNCTFYGIVPLTIEEDLAPCPFSLPDSLPLAVAKQPYFGSVAASPAGTYTYTIVQGWLGEFFSLDTTTGIITGSALVGDGMMFDFVVSVTDSTGCAKQKAYTITTTCPPPPTFSPLPNGQVGVPYSTFLTPSGGTGGYSYYLMSPLPNGLEFNEVGQISGVPLVAGSFYVQFFANGDALCDGYFSDMLVIEPAIVTCQATGTILRETWVKAKGYDVRQIPVNTPPTATRLLTKFEGPSNVTNRYGDRIRGYICPPISGDYTFWIASDDNSALFLSPDDQASNKQRIAWVNGATQPREWSKYASQQSAPIYLEAGKKYYIESLHKEAYGGDHVAVGWQLPGGALERPIPGNRLSPFEAPAARVAALDEVELAPAASLSAAPNPFSDQTTVLFTTPVSGIATVAVYDLKGGLVKVLFEGELQEGESKHLSFESTSVPSGIYLVKAISLSGVSHLKLVLAK